MTKIEDLIKKLEAKLWNMSDPVSRDLFHEAARILRSKEPHEERGDVVYALRAFDEIAWMAARYAHGRATYAPSLVRRAVQLRTELGRKYGLEFDTRGVGLERIESPMIPSDDLTDVFPPTVNRVDS